MSTLFEDSKKDPDKTFIIDYAPLFADLNLFEKKLIMQKSKVIEYKKGDVVYAQASPPDAFYCVITGRIKITIDGKQREPIEYLNCGKYFGMISVLTGEPHSVNAVAANDSKILRISKEDFHVILDWIPRLGVELSKTLSRRLRKKEKTEKKIFESTILSVFGVNGGFGRTMYAVNIALGLRKETSKNIILVGLGKSVNEICQISGLVIDQFAGDKECPGIKLDTPFPTEETIKNALLHDPVSGVYVLNILYDQIDSLYLSNLNAILTQLTGKYHYIIIDFPVLLDEVVYQVLAQSDSIHIITGQGSDSLSKTKVLVKELSNNFNYPSDRMKIIHNQGKDNASSLYKDVCSFLEYNVYATLPEFQATGNADIEQPVSRLFLDQPDTEYSRVIRRIARDVGDVRVGLSLGGGAAFGLAHIGVIKILEKEKIPVDMITGSSIGALIGALWAAGYTSQEIEKIVLEYDANKKKVFRLLFDPCFPKLSFAKGARIRAFLEKYLGNKTFQDTKIPIKIFACNLSKREEIIFDSGSLVDAIMASIAIPGVFAPLKIKNDLIIDGGIIEPVSIGSLVKMGIKKIIAVNVLPSPEDIERTYAYSAERRQKEQEQALRKGRIAAMIHKIGSCFYDFFFPNILDIIVNSMQTLEYVISENNCLRADVVLRPKITGVEWFEFYKAKQLILNGEQEAVRLLADIKNLINE